MSVIQRDRRSVSAVSRYNHRRQYADLPAVLARVESLLVSGDYILGAEVCRFEAAFAAYCGCARALGVNTGTDALVIALKALGIGRGDQVIAPANTFHATVAAIELSGAKPVLVDAREDDFLLDQSQLAAVCDNGVRALIPVHLFGKPVPMRGLLEFARQRNLFVVEDAAQAHGASAEGQRVGSFGDAGCFSFHPSKNLAAAGDGGAIVTHNEALADRCGLFRSLGQSAQNVHQVVGLNSKLDSLQALILNSKLSELDDWNESRAHIAACYRSALEGLPLSFQAHDDRETHVYHLFQVRTRYRDALLQFLKARGVDVVVRYPTPIHLQPAFAKWGWSRGDFPVAEALADELLCLPIRPDMDESEVAFVSDAVGDFFRSLSSSAP